MSEKGHAKNVETFEKMVGFVVGWGLRYNPSNQAIQLTALQTKLTQAKTSLETVITTRTPYTESVTLREESFAKVNSLIRRSMSILKSSGVSEGIFADAQSISRKVLGKKATPKPTKPSNGTSSEVEKTHSSSQMSYINRHESLVAYVDLLENTAPYKPNEVELQTASIRTFADTLETQNTTVITSFVPLSNARANRNNVLYDTETGLFEVAKMVKDYAKGAFGVNSPEYKQIKGLSFRNIE
jgi:hypothetical protein